LRRYVDVVGETGCNREETASGRNKQGREDEGEIRRSRAGGLTLGLDLSFFKNGGSGESGISSFVAVEGRDEDEKSRKDASGDR
jgi:hypothetical protein